MRKAKDIARSSVGKDNRPHDYFNQRPYWRPFPAWVYLILLAAMGASTGLLYVFSDQTAFLNGPLSTPHANVRCEDCHRQHFSSVSDVACMRCHYRTIRVDAESRAAHHHFEDNYPGRCTVCHLEHQGDIALDAIEDQDCTRCHGLLPEREGRRVTRFTAEGGDHPEFRLWRDGSAVDPGKLKFPHKAHLDPRGVLVGPDGGPENRKVMNCEDCHELDAAGERMLPIDYEKHCGGCHAHRIHALARGEVPHDSPEAIRAFLFRYFNEHSPELGAEAVELSALPERRPWLDEDPLERAIRGRVAAEEAILYGRRRVEGYSRCEQCHHLVPGVTASVPGLAALPSVAPPEIPRRWFSKALFNHRDHFSSRIECRHCHFVHSESGSEKPAGPIASVSATDVLIPRLETCLECHTDGKESNNCAFCHTFHPEPDEPERKAPRSERFEAALSFRLEPGRRP